MSRRKIKQCAVLEKNSTFIVGVNLKTSQGAFKHHVVFANFEAAAQMCRAVAAKEWVNLDHWQAFNRDGWKAHRV
jgi:cytoplasmic iron level regulating protein YaaA (DUF328/UPF0246 family)